MAAFIKKGIEGNSYETDVAYDGKNAEKLAIQFNYDLFIVDIIIPFVNGLDLCRKFNKRIPMYQLLCLRH
jgi:two-component system copper resistance phosphate regulon response regulator CusR